MVKKLKQYLLSLENKILPPQSLTQNIQDAHTLPYFSLKGIVAQLRVDREYKDCHEVEGKFLDKWRGRTKLTDLEEAEDIVYALCYLFGISPIETIKHEDEKANYHSYSTRKKTIYILKREMVLVSLLHELAHHFHYERHTTNYVLANEWHEKVFCDIEKEIFDRLLELQEKNGGKKLKVWSFSARDLLWKE